MQVIALPLTPRLQHLFKSSKEVQLCSTAQRTQDMIYSATISMLEGRPWLQFSALNLVNIALQMRHFEQPP